MVATILFSLSLSLVLSLVAALPLDGVPATSPTSYVRGKAFDRVAFIWLENTDYDKAIGDPNLAWLAKKGITLTQNYAVTHPSQPNYIAAIGGDYFGMNNDDVYHIPSNISTVLDLLATKSISWAEYQESMPTAGFTGTRYLNQQNGANAYVRKHNPAVIYDSAALSTSRLSQMKPLTDFHTDLAAGTLPQWMFITPNMTSNGHDTSVTTAGKWSRAFLEPLLDDKRFMNNTLVLLTFDECDNYDTPNRVLGVLLGDAVPAELVGTVDSGFYNHYSEIATVSANWGLDTLGRWDVGANVYKFVAEKTGDTVRTWGADGGAAVTKFKDMKFNSEYPGPMNTKVSTAWKGKWPAPNVDAVFNGRKVLDSIKAAWRDRLGKEGSYYGTGVETADGKHPPKVVVP